MTELLQTEVPEPLAGQRVDRGVAMLVGCTRAEAAAMVDAGAVRIDGRRVRKGAERLVAGTTLAIEPPDDPHEPIVGAESGIVFSVVHADDDLIVVDKPAGLVVHPGAGRHHGTLCHGLVARFPEIAAVGDPARPGIVHRLDKGTSGLMLVARSTAAYDALTDQIARRAVERRYLTVVWGHLDHDRGVIDAPLGRSRRRPTRQAVVADGRAARTHYEVERRAEEPASTTVVRCRLETGRTHQIRVHMASIGHPVVGDDRYDGVRDAMSFPRPALHAVELALAHPTSGAGMRFVAEPPADMAMLIGSLTGRDEH